MNSVTAATNIFSQFYPPRDPQYQNLTSNSNTKNNYQQITSLNYEQDCSKTFSAHDATSNSSNKSYMKHASSRLAYQEISGSFYDQSKFLNSEESGIKSKSNTVSYQSQKSNRETNLIDFDENSAGNVHRGYQNISKKKIQEGYQNISEAVEERYDGKSVGNFNKNYRDIFNSNCEGDYTNMSTETVKGGYADISAGNVYGVQGSSNIKGGYQDISVQSMNYDCPENRIKVSEKSKKKRKKSLKTDLASVCRPSMMYSEKE